MKSSLVLALTFASILIFSDTTAQKKKKIKYGKVSKEELEMQYYSGDSTAEAVILSDIGQFDNRHLKFYRHLRVKILKKSGTSWGNWTFDVPSKGAISGIVYNLEDGEVVEEKLKNSSIYEEEVIDDYILYKVFMPNVRVGSVIDIRYNFYGVPFEWRFQERIPIVHNRLIMEKNPNVDFRISSGGFEPITTVKAGAEWEVNNMPAFRPEPYMNDYSNYISKFQIELRSINIPGVLFKTYTTSWERVGGYFAEHDYVGGVLRNSGFLNGFAKDISELDLTLDQKIDTAYSNIKSNIKWNDEKSTYATAGLRAHFLKEHSGNAAEINLLLVSLLNKMEIDAVPVTLSTRDNGMLNPFAPTINKLNYVVCYVREDDKNIFLDATDEDLAPGYLPIRCINGKGRYFDEEYTGWVNLDLKSKYHTQSVISIKQDGTSFSASINRKLSEYDYLDWKESFDDLGSEANYRSSFENSHPGLFIESYDKEIDKSNLSATETIELDVTEFVDDLGNEIYIPVNILMVTENPFKKPERKYPVDFIMPRSDFQMISIELDEGYQVASIPEPVRIKLPDDGGEFIFITNAQGNKVQIQCKYRIDQTLFTADQYPFLQSFYMQMIGKLNEAIQVVKKT